VNTNLSMVTIWNKLEQVVNDAKTHQQVGEYIPPAPLYNNNNVQQLNHLEFKSRSKETHFFL
jgi:hypothetical protein